MEEKTVALSPDSAANANHQTQNKSSMDPPEVQANVLGSGEGSGWTATSKEIVNKRGRGRPRKYEHGIPIINGSLEAFPYQQRPIVRQKDLGDGLRVLASFRVWLLLDLVNTIVSFCGRASRSVCVLTASGAVSSVTLCAPGSSVGTLTYEGRFEILTLSGSSVVSGEPGTRQRTGLLSVSLANPHGRVFGGSVEGPLIAAGPGPIQLIVASFKQNIGREIRRKYCGGTSASANIFASSEMVNAPINQVSATAEDHEKCTSPPPVAVIMKADCLKSNTIVAEINNINPTSLQSIDPNNLQKTENLIAENHDFSSEKMAGSNNLQTSPVQQPLSDEMMIDNSGH
ncbi:hypothetical protein ES319_A07G116600v1 [Gossypium barbadense]|uniref:AT-hook motif nuclear-localized protein n=2 Tax=Gossypium TaxID=3633 RepID=A0A5J5V2N7_GOSBA|nr:hypothetical protein ES319_A07G116600v1 [Gossypium barbadense]TYH09785.1 hypothetical protein ES288_A07G124700v1 [Gossypium darwinii]